MNFTKKIFYFFILFILFLQIINCGSSSLIGEKSPSDSNPSPSPSATTPGELKIKVKINNIPSDAIKVVTQAIFENYPAGQVPPGNNEITDLSQAQSFILTLAAGVKGKFQIIIKAVNKDGCATGVGTSEVDQLENISAQSDPFSIAVNLLPQSCTACGNGKLDLGEWCDGNQMMQPLGKPMTCDFALLIKGQFDSTPASGKVQCNADCTLDTSACVSFCGNGKVDVQIGEECDAKKSAQDQSQSIYCSQNCKTTCVNQQIEGVVVEGAEETFSGNGSDNANGAGHCYYDVRLKKDFVTAENICETNLKGHLLVINSPDEYNAVIRDVIQKETGERRWIGLRRDFDSSDSYWFDNFYWIPYSWGINTKQAFDKDLAWKGRQGRAPEAVISKYDFLQSLWNDGEPSYCNNWLCTSTEPAVEILSLKDGYKLNDDTEGTENYFICEIEPSVLYVK